jgi:hypothetical protein
MVDVLSLTELKKLQLVKVGLCTDPPSTTSLEIHNVFLPHLESLILADVHLFAEDIEVPINFFLNPRSLPALTQLALLYSGDPPPVAPSLPPSLTHLLLYRHDDLSILPLDISGLPVLRHLSLDIHNGSELDLAVGEGVPSSLVSLEIRERDSPKIERKSLSRESLIGRGLKYLVVELLNADPNDSEDSNDSGRDAKLILRSSNKREAERLGIELRESAEDRKTLSSVDLWFELTKRLDKEATLEAPGEGQRI